MSAKEATEQQNTTSLH